MAKKHIFIGLMVAVALLSEQLYASEGFFGFRMFGGYISIPDEFSVTGIAIKGEKCFDVRFSRQREGEAGDSRIITMKYMNCRIKESDTDKNALKELEKSMVNGFEVVKLEYVSATNKVLNGKCFYRANLNGATLYFFGEDYDNFVENTLKTYEEL